MAGKNWLIFGMQPPIGTKLTKMGAVGKKKWSFGVCQTLLGVKNLKNHVFPWKWINNSTLLEKMGYIDGEWTKVDCLRSLNM